MRDENVNNPRNTEAADRAGTGMQDCLATQRETMLAGLRILARIIARIHLERQAERAAPKLPPERRSGG